MCLVIMLHAAMLIAAAASKAAVLIHIGELSLKLFSAQYTEVANHNAMHDSYQ